MHCVQGLNQRVKWFNGFLLLHLLPKLWINYFIILHQFDLKFPFLIYFSLLLVINSHHFPGCLNFLLLGSHRPTSFIELLLKSLLHLFNILKSGLVLADNFVNLRVLFPQPVHVILDEMHIQQQRTYREHSYTQNNLNDLNPSNYFLHGVSTIVVFFFLILTTSIFKLFFFPCKLIFCAD